ncbi:MAG: hypothetical protein ABI776_03830 [Nocardioidaceae bacterium]
MRITRKPLAGLGAIVAVLCTATAATALGDTPQHATPRSGSSNVHQLSGTWATSIRISDAPPGAPSAFNALDTFEPGGGLVVSSSAPQPTTRSLAHGYWAHAGHRTYTSTFVWFRFDTSGAYVGTQRVRRTMRLSHDGERFRGTDVISVMAPSGAVVATLHAIESGTLLAD